MNADDAARLLNITEFPPGWIFHPIYRNRQLAGFFCTNENEIHCFRLDSFKGQWFPRFGFQRLTAPLFEQYGCLRTKVEDWNTEGQAFVTRLGFKEVGKEQGMVFYEAIRLKHSRG